MMQVISNDDAVSVVALAKCCRNEVASEPVAGSSWTEDEPGIWILPVSDSILLVYYQVDSRIEIESSDFCMGVVGTARIGVVDGFPSLVLVIEGGLSLTVPMSEVRCRTCGWTGLDSQLVRRTVPMDVGCSERLAFCPECDANEPALEWRDAL